MPIKKSLTDDELQMMSSSKKCCDLSVSLIDNSIFGDDAEHELTFSVYDGVAVARNYDNKNEGNDLVMVFPKFEFAKKNLSATILEYCGLKSANDIEIKHVIKTYNKCIAS